MEPQIEEEEEESTNQGLQTIRSRHSRDMSIDSTRTSVGLNLFPEIFENSQELLKTIKFLKLENYLLEEHLKREEPVLLEGMTEYVAQRDAKNPFIEISKMSWFSSFTAQTTSSYRTSTPQPKWGSHHANFIYFGTGKRVNLLTRIEMAKRQIEEINKKVAETKLHGEERKEYYDAAFQEIQARIAKLEIFSQAFESLCKSRVDTLTGKMPAKVLMRFLSYWNNRMDRKIFQLRLKRDSLKARLLKLTDILYMKQELWANITPVDFDKIKILNQDLVKKIGEQLHNIEKVKVISVKRRNMLSAEVAIVEDQLITLNDGEKSLKKEETKIQKLEQDIALLRAENDLNLEELNQSKKLREMFIIPSTHDYVVARQTMAKLEKNIKDLKRRRALQSHSLNKLKRKFNEVYMQKWGSGQASMIKQD